MERHIAVGGVVPLLLVAAAVSQAQQQLRPAPTEDRVGSHDCYESGDGEETAAAQSGTAALRRSEPYRWADVGS